MNNNEKEKIKGLIKKYTYEPAKDSFLDVLENEMKKVVSLNDCDHSSIEVYAKFLFSREKYEEAIKAFNSILNVDECRARAIYGLYKCYVMKGNYKNAYKSIIEYIDERKSMDVLSGMHIILSCFEIIFDKRFSNIEVSNLFLMNKINDSELKEKYAELIDNFNKKNFSRCITLAEECDEICKSKKILIEFETFKNLLIEVKRVSTPNLYIELKQARTEKNYNRMVEIINELPKINIKELKLYYSSLYLLIRNGYYRELENVLSNLEVTKDNKIILSALRKAVLERIEYEKLSDIQKENCSIARKLGKKHYKAYDIETAYDLYLYGLYTTEYSVFYYYIGKMFFKKENYRDAKKYLEKYASLGTEKLGKAYVYLAAIYTKLHKNQKALHYSKMVEKLNLIYSTDYEMFYIYDSTNPEEDSVKMRLQTNKSMYKNFYNDKKVLLKKK